jgi:VWFA-related protein
MSFQGLRLLAGVAAACGAAAVLTAQQQPVFRAGVELVQIDAVVTDRQDRPVGGLTAADFSIFENGRRQTIVDFRPVSIPSATRTIDPKATPSAFVANDQPSNRRLFVLVVDNVHIRPVDMRRPRELLSALLQGLSPDDQVAVVTTAATDASLDLTSDPVLQARAVAALGARTGTPWGFTARPGHEITFDILENVIESLAHSRHARRVVVYVSPVTGLTWVDQRGTLKMLREGFSRTVDAARRANVALYAVHPIGADSGETGSAFEHASFARESGGRGFGFWSDYRTVVRSILEDNSTFYAMSYYRDPASVRDGEPSIEVRPAKPDLQVRARKGYVAEAKALPDAPTLSAALAEPLSVNGVRLRASVTPRGPATGNRVTADLTVEVTYPAEPGATRVTDELQFGVLAIDYDARVLATRGRVMPVDQPATGVDTPHVIRDTIDLPPGTAVVRLGVSSKLLGRIGTVHVPVRILR